MKEFIKHNTLVLVAFVLPLLLIFFVAGSVLLSSARISTEYNFLYATCQTAVGTPRFLCGEFLEKSLSVQEGALIIKDIDVASLGSARRFAEPTSENLSLTMHVFLHTTEKNVSAEISLEEAQGFVLDEKITSPDGITFSGHTVSSDGFPLFFGSRSSFNHYLVSGRNQRTLNLIPQDQFRGEKQINFIGWVLSEQE